MEQEKDIVERLRKWAFSSTVDDALMQEAADEIERLRQYNREIEQTARRLEDISCEQQTEIERLRAEHAEDVHSNLKLHDEIERLRAKLREIATCEHCEGGDHVTLADIGQGLVREKTETQQDFDKLKKTGYL